MGVRLYSIEHLPSWVPIWQLILEDLGDPPAARVARALNLSVRTVRRYNRAGSAPKSVCLALFWLTRWGRSAVHTQATNDAIVACGYVDALRRQVAQLQLQLDHVLRRSDVGSANAPLLREPRP